MGNYEELKAAVSSVIKTNGNQEITGQVLQNTLTTLISQVGVNATFAGIATPETVPGMPDQNVFYIASKKGIYTNFGGYNLTGSIVIFTNNTGSWVVREINSASYDDLVQLEAEQVKASLFKKDIVLVRTDHLFSPTTGVELPDVFVYGLQSDFINCGDVIGVQIRNIQNSVGTKYSYLVFYDENKNIVSNYATTEYNDNLFDSGVIKKPDSAKFFRTSNRKTSMVKVPDIDIYLSSTIEFQNQIEKEILVLENEQIVMSDELSKQSQLFDYGTNLFIFAQAEYIDKIIQPGYTYIINYAGGRVSNAINIDSSKTYDYNKKPYSIFIIKKDGTTAGVPDSNDFKSFGADVAAVRFSFLKESDFNNFVYYEAGTKDTAYSRVKPSQKFDAVAALGVAQGDLVVSRGDGNEIKYQVLGDSTVANDNLNADGTDYEYNGETQYQQQGIGRRVCKILGIDFTPGTGNFYNTGMSGWTAVQWANSMKTLAKIKPGCHMYQIDLGTNDWGNNTGGISYGTLQDYIEFDSNSSITIKKTAQAFRRIVDYIFSIQTQTNFTPYICFVTPTRRGAWGYKNINGNVLYAPNDSEIVSGQYLKGVVDLIHDICQYEGFGVIDLYNDSIVNYRQLSKMTYDELAALDISTGIKSTDVNQDVLIDNLHMTAKGYNIIAQRVAYYYFTHTNLFQQTIKF